MKLLRFRCLQQIARHGRSVMPGEEFEIKSTSSRAHVDRWLSLGKIEAIADSAADLTTVEVGDVIRTNYSGPYRVIAIQTRGDLMYLTCVLPSFPEDYAPGANHRFWLNNYRISAEPDGSFRHLKTEDRIFIQTKHQPKSMKDPGSTGATKARKKTAAAAPQKAATTATSSSSTRSAAETIALKPMPQEERRVSPKLIVRSPFNRKKFDPEKLKEMIESVRELGVLQPVLVRPVKEGEWFLDPGKRSGVQGFFVISRGYLAHYRACERNLDGKPMPTSYWSDFVPPFFTTEKEAEANLPLYELIAGERRWRGATGAGAETMPVIVHDVDDRVAVEMQIVENLQREDVQPMDEARSYRHLQEMGFSIDEIAAKLKIGKSTIYARLKLLELPDTARAMVEEGKLPASHAELITRAKTPEARERLAKSIMTPKDVYNDGDYRKELVSFREAEQLADAAVKDEKAEEEWQTKAGEYREKGYTVFTRKQSEGVFQYGSLRAGYVGVTDKCDLDPEGRIWKALLGKSAPAVIAAIDGWRSQPRIVYARKAALKGLKEAGHDFAADPKATKEANEQAEKERREKEQEKKFVADSLNVEKLVAAAEARDPNADYFRFIVAGLIEESGVSEKLIRRRQIPTKEEDNYQKEKLALERFIQKADGKTLRGMAIEMFLWGWNGLEEESAQHLAKLWKVKLQTSGKKAGGDDEEDDDAE